jgi:3-hydroxyacyl-CoA dehydrogenase
MNESEALRHVEEAERAVAKVDGLAPGTPTVPIRSAAVVGFGTMGSGIAMAFANAGLPVRVLDETREAVDRGLASVRRTYEASRERGRLTPEEASARLDRIETTLDYADLAGADVVVEAVFEELEAKQNVFARLDTVCREDAILATNTSSLDVTRIARGTQRPERVVGMHFFSPAHVMRLVEVVRPDDVAPTTLATTVELAGRLGKIGVVVGVCDGFVGNRMLYAYRRQTDFLLEDGALPAQVDRALTAFGLPMGPYQMADLAGLDISWRIRKRQAATRAPGLRYSPIADRLCERGRFGQKTGAGWYRYEPGSRTPLPDPEVEETIKAVSAQKGIARREIQDEEIVERALFALVNEGARILEEGIAARAGDIDVIWIHGYGFPRARGGPMFWADGVGLARVAEVVQTLHAEQGDLVRPSARLLALARAGGRFSRGTGLLSPE